MRSALAFIPMASLLPGAFAAVDQLEEKAGYTVGTAPVPKAPCPSPVPPETPGAAIAGYSASETRTFESEAEEALTEKSARFDAEGLPVIGGRTFKTGRDHSFSLDYLSMAR